MTGTDEFGHELDAQGYERVAGPADGVRPDPRAAAPRPRGPQPVGPGVPGQPADSSPWVAGAASGPGNPGYGEPAFGAQQRPPVAAMPGAPGVPMPQRMQAASGHDAPTAEFFPLYDAGEPEDYQVPPAAAPDAPRPIPRFPSQPGPLQQQPDLQAASGVQQAPGQPGHAPMPQAGPIPQHPIPQQMSPAQQQMGAVQPPAAPGGLQTAGPQYPQPQQPLPQQVQQAQHLQQMPLAPQAQQLQQHQQTTQAQQAAQVPQAQQGPQVQQTQQPTQVQPGAQVPQAQQGTQVQQAPQAQQMPQAQPVQAQQSPDEGGYPEQEFDALAGSASWSAAPPRVGSSIPQARPAQAQRPAVPAQPMPVPTPLPERGAARPGVRPVGGAAAAGAVAAGRAAVRQQGGAQTESDPLASSGQRLAAAAQQAQASQAAAPNIHQDAQIGVTNGQQQSQQFGAPNAHLGNAPANAAGAQPGQQFAVSNVQLGEQIGASNPEEDTQTVPSDLRPGQLGSVPNPQREAPARASVFDPVNPVGAAASESYQNLQAQQRASESVEASGVRETMAPPRRRVSSAQPPRQQSAVGDDLSSERLRSVAPTVPAPRRVPEDSAQDLPSLPPRGPAQASPPQQQPAQFEESAQDGDELVVPWQSAAAPAVEGFGTGQVAPRGTRRRAETSVDEVLPEPVSAPQPVLLDPEPGDEEAFAPQAATSGVYEPEVEDEGADDPLSGSGAHARPQQQASQVQQALSQVQPPQQQDAPKEPVNPAIRRPGTQQATESPAVIQPPRQGQGVQQSAPLRAAQPPQQSQTAAPQQQAGQQAESVQRVRPQAGQQAQSSVQSQQKQGVQQPAQQQVESAQRVQQQAQSSVQSQQDQAVQQSQTAAPQQQAGQKAEAAQRVQPQAQPSAPSQQDQGIQQSVPLRAAQPPQQSQTAVPQQQTGQQAGPAQRVQPQAQPSALSQQDQAVQQSAPLRAAQPSQQQSQASGSQQQVGAQPESAQRVRPQARQQEAQPSVESQQEQAGQQQPQNPAEADEASRQEQAPAQPVTPPPTTSRRTAAKQPSAKAAASSTTSRASRSRSQAAEPQPTSSSASAAAPAASAAPAAASVPIRAKVPATAAPTASAPAAIDIPEDGRAPGYGEEALEAVYRVIHERRDIRNDFLSDELPTDVLTRILEAAHTAPSVGFSQPWDFLVLRDEERRQAVHDLAARQRRAYAASLPKARAKAFAALKIEAILETPVNIVVTCDPTRGGRHTLGRYTQPMMAPFSTCLAVENLWLAARAEGLGVGWVSFFDERELAETLGLPEHLQIVAYLCVGYVKRFPAEPELAGAGWARRRPLSWAVHEEDYGRRAMPGGAPVSLLDATVDAVRGLDETAVAAARERQGRMTKPPGSLGMLEHVAEQLAGLAAECPPPLPEPAALAVFAADHGVHAQGVTPWPQEVTAQMVANFLAGGAVVNAFAKQVGAEVCVVDVGVNANLGNASGLVPRKVRYGTADMTQGPAMSRDEAMAAIEAGIETARDLVGAGNRCLLTGDMGIANTTASAALIAAFTGASPAQVTGYGTGIDEQTYAHKVEIVRRALELHRPDPQDPIGVLSAFGGLEHAALAGFILGGSALRVPVVLDGVIAGAAALVAQAIAPEVTVACVAGHRSAEPGHALALEALGINPLIDLELRLGEGSGAVLALPLVAAAVRALREVATFDAAGVADASSAAVAPTERGRDL